MALTTLYPATPDGTSSGMNAPVGAATHAEALLTNDGDTSYSTAGVDSSGHVFLNLDNTPSDFDRINTLSVSCVVSLFGTVSDDTVSLYAQVFSSDETTALTDEILVTDQLTGAPYTVDTTALTLAAAGTNGSKATWDGARLRLRWAYVKTKASDGISLRVTQAYLDVDYTALTPLTPAQHIEHFGEATVGQDVTTILNWERIWGTGSTDTITESDTPSGKKVHHVPTVAGTRSPVAYTGIELTDVYDYRVKFRVTPETVVGAGAADYFRVMTQLSGASGSENAYFAELQTATDGARQIEIVAYQNGSTIGIALEAFAWDVGIWYQIRIQRAEGSVPQWKIWADADPEPATWLNFHPDTPALPRGYFGWGSLSTTLEIDIDYISIGSGGAEAAVPTYVPGSKMGGTATMSVVGTREVYRYEEDFSTMPLGAPPTDFGWINMWSVSADDYIEYVDTPSGRTAVHSALSNARRAVVHDHVVVGDYDFIAKVRLTRVTGTTGDYLRLHSNVSGPLGSETGLMIEFTTNTGPVQTIDTRQYSNGTLTSLDTTTHPWELNKWYYVRGRREGDTFMWKYWELYTAEPSTWNVTLTVTLPDGRLGYGSFSISTIGEIDYFAYAEDGEVATYPPAETLSTTKTAKFNMSAGASMTTYVPPVSNLITFDAATPGSTLPAGYVEIWSANVIDRVIESPSHLGSKLIFHKPTADNFTALTFQNLGTNADCDIRARVRPTIHTAKGAHLIARAGGAAGTETGITVEINNLGRTVLRRYDGGVMTFLDSEEIPLVGKKWYNLRLRVVGTTAQAKAWGDVEPSNWMLEADIGSTITTGYIGVGAGNIDEIEWDALSYAFNGAESPPIPAVPRLKEVPALQRRPLTPGNFRAINRDGQVTLSWDSVEAANGYEVYKDGALLVSTTNTSYIDNVVAEHVYHVVAYRSIP